MIMAVFQGRLNKSVDDAKDANTLKFKSVVDQVLSLERKTEQLGGKVDHVDEKLTSLTMKVAVITTEQRHLINNFSEFRDEVKNFRHENFGKVIKK